MNPNIANNKIKMRANLIHKLLINIVNDVIENEEIEHITINGVNLSNDLSFCTVFYSILNKDDHTSSLLKKILEENKKEIRAQLASKIRNMKKIPQLIFQYDNSLNYGEKIDKLLETIKK
ncbi:30S ribosome-binding factor RbfA [Candidatus Phytoplasma pini]|uniref:Ribosome-binding factor A n=1 Tax=Candidatus Phytoplasma pini TaxID=267362 RepID=A0A559KJ35_9MOLU|nr:30S ribosome-binding factor RbfA [Candidatus Phytoplasma pini]TVY12136.1 Ribosome-binding factor A [Candidatus Phytoplasma pini]